jgi:ribosomal protein S18 acetylase RimI-like enzyme
MGRMAIRSVHADESMARVHMQVRAARADETAAIAVLHVRATRETYAPILGARAERRDFDQSRARWEAAIASGDILLVAAEADVIVGLLHVEGDWMQSLYLASSHHRRGIGTRLLAAAGAELKARGVDEFGFRCVAENLGAIAFYEAIGARRVGRSSEGEGADAVEHVAFVLTTDAAAALRRD